MMTIWSPVVLGCCLTAAVFLSLTTIHYRWLIITKFAIQIQKDKNTNTIIQNPHHSDQWSEVLFLRCCNLHVFSSFDVDDDTNDDHHIGHIYHLMTTVMLMLMVKLNNKHHCMGFAHFLHKFFNRNLDLRL